MSPSTSRTGERRVSRRTLLGGGLGTLAALGGTSVWAANRYLIDDVQVAHASTLESGTTTAGASGTGTKAATSTATTYASDTASIAITTVTSGTGSDRLTYFVADVTVSDATVVRSAFAQDEFGQNIIANPSTIAGDVGAVLAVNGDYYGFRDTGMVIRNGVVFRDEGGRQGLAFYTDGRVELYDETATTAAALVADGVWNTLSFGPGLVDNNAVIPGVDDVEIDTNFGNHSVQGRQPRTGVGMVTANRLLFIVVDGRSANYSRGVTMSEFAQIFVDHGAQVAYNLDGGGSSTMIFSGDLVNNPLGRGEERGTSDIIYVAG